MKKTEGWRHGDVVVEAKTKDEAKEKLEKLSYYGRYKKAIIEDAKSRLEE